MTEQLIDLLPEHEQLTPEQKQIVHLIQGHITLQDQFTQLTNHVEGLYKRYNELERMIMDCTKLLHKTILK
jgi:predicted nuclease with TOPRIM domain